MSKPLPIIHTETPTRYGHHQESPCKVSLNPICPACLFGKAHCRLRWHNRSSSIRKQTEKPRSNDGSGKIGIEPTRPDPSDLMNTNIRKVMGCHRLHQPSLLLHLLLTNARHYHGGESASKGSVWETFRISWCESKRVHGRQWQVCRCGSQTVSLGQHTNTDLLWCWVPPPKWNSKKYHLHNLP